MAQKIPVKYENSAHDIFRPGDTLPPEFLDDTSIIAGPGIKVTRLANGTFVIENLCFPCEDEPCVPNWTNVGSPYCQGDDCVQLQQDGCGNTRTIPSTGCSPECGGCVPNWTNSGPPYCVGNSCMQDQVDGCGNIRTVAGTGCVPECGTCTPNYVATSTYECREDGRYYRWWVDTNNCGGMNGQWQDVGPVTWTNNGEQVCDGTTNTWHQPEINQCGVTRLRDTGVPCEEPCVPSDWEDVPGSFRCDGNQTQKQQFNGCEYRWVSTGHVWEDTGTFRCVEVEGVCQYQKQERSVYCPDVRRYVTIEPCTWTPTGEDRCEGGFIEIEEENQCGDKRWTTTTTPCGGPPDLSDLDLIAGCCAQMAGENSLSIHLLNTGVMHVGRACEPGFDGTWLPDGANASDYEAKLNISYTIVGNGGTVTPAGGNPSSDGTTWVNLGTSRQWNWTFTGAGTPPNDATACFVGELKVRKVGDPEPSIPAPNARAVLVQLSVNEALCKVCS